MVKEVVHKFDYGHKFAGASSTSVVTSGAEGRLWLPCWLEADDYRRGGPSLIQVNKVHHVHNIARVSAMLGEDENWPWDVATKWNGRRA